ncbi:uncharacterized protein LOC130796968 [Amaranthus tricolor]|uniref:uncharacterized protein LOC130796968 n=1 Tax=Amaranthus tricolor TaxID=29722 RepID=UPI00258E0680|nr:uncharacterized protein LOC130796968 [Amaranthus tricolor]
MSMLFQETQNPFVPSPSCTLSQPPPNQVSIDAMVNLGESNEVAHWDDGNESNELVDDPSEDDVDVDEDALATDMTLGNNPTIIAPTPYALVLPLDEHVEENSWRTWACDTTYTEEGEFEKGMMFDSMESLLEAIRVYHIRRNVDYRTETSNQTILTLKCKRGCS